MGTLRIIPNPLSYSIHLQLTPSDLSINPLSHILRSILQMVCLIKGICHGKHYHAAHIAAVLSRAWIAGVERIVVSLRSHFDWGGEGNILYMCVEISSI
ncbi:uncharacterized protein LOC111443234 isoform X2 [Cucurbita moschata]|uniref:Uncharacterized protein LOC111443234 isoform X2 n=1 Tax=Cucurbita moschata TaxID=3662 RepID=A0A6J1F950_CUCMO|nr:uncharacterized protein LOC111443234 isoform X2 [Cucurbita moschata]